MSVVIETTLGDVTVDLFIEERPQTCLNFLKLCKIKYYNLCLFHSVNSNFLAQTGDPTGKGDGGESIFGLLKGKQHRLYQGEKVPRIKHDRTGLLSMVSHGDGMLGSQFVITLSGNLTSLDQEHCVFGCVVEGVDLLLKLNEAITDEQHRPYQDIRITHTVILDDPFPDPKGLEVPPQSPLPPNPKDIAYSRIPADEPLTENYSQEELDEMVQQREAAARAAILEMVGDIPDADIAPPENVLFVCKLNPVTSDHDLSIIFSRFGTVKSCEVIRDQVTGDSLQYAFIEFEDRKACEDAYFKMDNVLIDDRRIHVDFSQSVAKLKWKGKGRGVEYLGPPPSGGWGNKSRDEPKQRFLEKHRSDNNKAKYLQQISKTSNRYQNQTRNGREDNKHRGMPRTDEKKSLKREKIKRRKSSSTSTTSDSLTDTSETSSGSTESSDAKRKKHKTSQKVLVVVKAPRSVRSRKKSKRNKTKYKKRESDTESESDERHESKRKRKKVRRRSTSTESSSEDEEVDRKKRKRINYQSWEDEPKAKRKKKTKLTDSSEESSSEVEQYHKRKSKNRKPTTSDSSSESDGNKSSRRKRGKPRGRKKSKRQNKRR
ncbi:hypothetical protein RUM43_014832 [Polyplax serrata]|uniref:Peptidyl-prolyl cis-trans isomerase n=1 Tax=Polyplax serrata TaxID=468196 RepID=A0AAN8PGJ6_POLSC